MSPLFHIDVAELPYLAPYFVSIFIALGLLIYLFRRRRLPVASIYVVVMVFETMTTLAYILEISAEMLPAKVFWDDVQWFTLFGEAVSLVVFAMYFTQRPPRNTASLVGTLSIVPALYLGVMLFGSDLLPTRLNTRLIEAEPLNALIYDFTPVSYAVAVYLLLLGFVTVGVLGVRSFRSDPIYRGQIITVMIGVAIPTIVGLTALSGIQLTLQRDLTPISFVVSNLVVTYGLMRYRLFDVAPIARQTVFENMAEPVIVLDSSLRVVDYNPAARKMLDPERVTGIGRPASEVFHEWKAEIESLRDAPYETEVRTIATSRARIWSVSVSPILTRDNLLLGRVLILHDVTEVHAARAAAEKANLVKSQFLASMSHELRTPLNAIINFNEVVLRGLVGPITPDAEELLRKARDSSLHLLDLINDVLDISKMQSGALTLDREIVGDLDAEIERLVEMARGMIGERPVTLRVECSEALPALNCDRRRLRQVLINLLSNAAKFTLEGEIRLLVYPQGETLRFEVIDTGPGIALEHQQAIFEPFVQTEDGRKQIEGTGLGLAISRRLAEAHGGRLWVESQPGQGARFVLEIPVAPEAL